MVQVATHGTPQTVLALEWTVQSRTIKQYIRSTKRIGGDRTCDIRINAGLEHCHAVVGLERDGSLYIVFFGEGIVTTSDGTPKSSYSKDPTGNGRGKPRCKLVQGDLITMGHITLTVS